MEEQQEQEHANKKRGKKTPEKRRKRKGNVGEGVEMDNLEPTRKRDADPPSYSASLGTQQIIAIHKESTINYQQQNQQQHKAQTGRQRSNSGGGRRGGRGRGGGGGRRRRIGRINEQQQQQKKKKKNKDKPFFVAVKDWVKETVSRMAFVSLLFMVLSIIVPVGFAMALVSVRGNGVLDDQTVNTVMRMGDGLETLVREVLRTSEGVTNQVAEGFGAGLYSVNGSEVSVTLSLFKTIITSFVQCSFVSVVLDSGPIYGCFLSSERTQRAYMWYTYPNKTACYMDYSLQPDSPEARATILRCGPPQENSIARAARVTAAYLANITGVTNVTNATVAARIAGWSPVFKAAGNAFYTYSRKAYDSAGSPVGMVMAGTNLMSINDLLASTSGRGGAIVFNYDTLQILSTTIGLRLKVYENGVDDGAAGGTNVWGNASNFDYVYVNSTDSPFVQEMHEMVTRRYGSWQAAVGHSFYSGKNKNFVSVRLVERPGLRWIVATMSRPETVRMSVPIIIVTVVVTLLVTMFFGLTTYSTVRSIQSIANSMRDISKLNFDGVESSNSANGTNTATDGGGSGSSSSSNSTVLPPPSSSSPSTSTTTTTTSQIIWGNESESNSTSGDGNDDSNGNGSTAMDIEEGHTKKSGSGESGTKHKMRFFREIRDMDDSFQKLKAGARALTHYIAPSVALEVLQSERNEWSRREVQNITIMFVGLHRFTALSETMRYEQLSEILNKWFEVFGKIIYQHGGIIDKFIGNSIMGLFGAPRQLPSNEEAACRTALSMAVAMPQVNSWVEHKGIVHRTGPIGFHVGIHSGDVLVGHIGYSQHMNYTVCGNAANVASRVDQLGKEFMLSPLISGNVAERVKDVFLCVFLDARKIRGHKKTVTLIYHLLCLKTDSNTKVELAIVKTFNKIHRRIRKGRTEEANALIDRAAAEEYMADYVTALGIIRSRLNSGLLTPDMYPRKKATSTTKGNNNNGDKNGGGGDDDDD